MADFNFLNLNDEIRQFMVGEIKNDISLDKLFISNRLSTTGKAKYPELLIEVANSSTEVQLANNLQPYNE